MNNFKTAIYVRLSKEDGDKAESYSISNQRELLVDYINGNSELVLCDEMVDDGYSGSNYNRPGFLKLMEAIHAGKINCIVVKDLSRFGRDYIDTGRYINNILPSLGVRLIAVNDNYDSAVEASSSEKILIPFKNIINDSYCRDISVKIRSHLEVKRKRGEYVGSFVVYGYMKDAKDRHKIVVDEYAANVVRDIFKWKIEGMSQQGIADRLNACGVLSPYEYKKFCGFNFATGFKTNPQAKWSAVAVGRILKNQFYTGMMIQGKRSTPNHKVKHMVMKEESEWARVENTHEAIISSEDYETVSGLLLTDTRIAPNRDKVYLFSGLLYCKNCGSQVVRKTIPSGGKKYIYYVCQQSGCQRYCINESELEKAVFATIRLHIENILDVEKALDFVKSSEFASRELRRHNKALLEKKAEIEKYEKYKKRSYELLMEGLINKEEYLSAKSEYVVKLENSQKALELLENEINDIITNKSDTCAWIEFFKKYKSIEKLTRDIVVNLIDSIYIMRGNRIEIVFRYQFQYESAMSFINSAESIPLKAQVI